VHDVEPVEDLEGLEELPEGLEGLPFGEGAFPFECLLKSASAAVLIDEVVVVFGLEVVLVPDYVFARADAGEGVDLIDGAGFKQCILLVFFNRNDLDCELTHFLCVYGSVHLAEIPLADFLNERIVINNFNHPVVQL
jgi:hypothetical protein